MPEPLDRLTAALASRYRIERQLGSGGMATVYLAEDLKHHRQVALKVLRPELAAVLGPDRFLREIEIAAKLNHPHILPLFDSGEADGVLFYVMPYVAGESLRDRLHREKQFGIEDALQIAREVADALDYAHRQGVLHRDIKPENILLEERHAVVADFGIARAITVAGGEKLTATGVALGTPEYMSPEQASGRGKLDGRSDIYALGCVLYEMLAGQPPFTGATVESVLQQHLLSDQPEVTQLRRTVGAETAAVLHRALEKAPADRYPTGVALAEALRNAAGASARTRPPALRGVVVAVLVAGLAILAGMDLWRRLRGPEPTGPAPLRIAVLPFENLGRPEDDFFADGMTEEITSQLAKVPGLGVIGRTSAMQYKGAGKPVRTIGAELEAEYVLEGTVRWSAGDTERRLRITPQLIRVADETHVWAEQYNAVYSDVFAVQAEIAARVATALGVVLASDVALADVSPPTRNLQAYEHYLRGNALYSQCALDVCEAGRLAVQQYENAVRLDPQFAAAWARIPLATMVGVRSGAAVPPRAREAAERALALAPHLADAHVAMGRLFYNTADQDLTRAEAAFRRALKLQPNHLEALFALGRVYRLRGDITTAAEVFKQHADLDPRAEVAQFNAGITYLRLRLYDEAERYLQRYVTLAPAAPEANRYLAVLYLMRDGDTAAARRTAGSVEGAFQDLDNNLGFLDLAGLVCSDCARWAQARLVRLGPPGDEPDAPWHPYMRRGRLARLAGDGALERVYLDSAAQLAKATIASGLKDDLHVRHDLAMVLAWRGQEEAAVQAAHELVRVERIARNGTVGPGAVTTAAEIFAQFGEDEAALELLERLLSGWSYVSVPLLRVYPAWRRFGNNPRFQALLVKHRN